MGLADTFSGGQNSKAANALEQALENLSGVGVPTAEQLTLPQLQQYVQAGILTPEQAQAYTIKNNAFDSITADNAGLDTELSTIGKLQDIINQGGNDAEEQSNIQGILNTLGTTESGENAAILADNARRGVANSGLTMAARLSGDQNAATNANANALNEGAAAEARNMAALNATGTLGGNVQGQQYTQEANKANAANAIANFNAQQQQQEENLNVNESNKAQAANLAEAQDVSDKNVAGSQMTQESAVSARQKAYEDALAKASAQTNIAESQAGQATQEGQQNAAILGGLISTAGTVGSAYAGNPYARLATSNNTTTPNTNMNTDNSNPGLLATGGEIMPHGIKRPMNMKSGGPVPGQPMVPGDSPMNDTQLAKLSPGEIVLPRSVTQPSGPAGPDPSKVMQFLKSLPKSQAAQSIHPKAVLDTLRGLSMHHSGVS